MHGPCIAWISHGPCSTCPFLKVMCGRFSAFRGHCKPTDLLQRQGHTRRLLATACVHPARGSEYSGVEQMGQVGCNAQCTEDGSAIHPTPNGHQAADGPSAAAPAAALGLITSRAALAAGIATVNTLPPLAALSAVTRCARSTSEEGMAFREP